MASMTSSKTYTAIYDYDADDNAWNVRIKGLTGCQTYGRSIRQAQSRVREALALWIDTAPAQLRVRDQFPAALASLADDVVRARSAADRAGAKAQQQTIEAVKSLTDLGSAVATPPNSSACRTSVSTNSSRQADRPLNCRSAR
jgi:predicted RNase H-like HicB family nuclease